MMRYLYLIFVAVCVYLFGEYVARDVNQDTLVPTLGVLVLVAAMAILLLKKKAKMAFFLFVLLVAVLVFWYINAAGDTAFSPWQIHRIYVEVGISLVMVAIFSAIVFGYRKLVGQNNELTVRQVLVGLFLFLVSVAAVVFAVEDIKVFTIAVLGAICVYVMERIDSYLEKKHPWIGKAFDVFMILTGLLLAAWLSVSVLCGWWTTENTLAIAIQVGGTVLMIAFFATLSAVWGILRSGKPK